MVWIHHIESVITISTVDTSAVTVGSRDRSIEYVTVIGGATLTGALLLNFAMPQLGLDSKWDDPTAWQYYLSNVPLLIGWGLLFFGAALAAREWHAHGLLGRLALGFGIVTAGFLGVVFAHLLGGWAVSYAGNMIAGIGMILGVAPGTTVLGVAALREKPTAGASAVLLCIAGVSSLGSLVVLGSVPEPVSMAMFLLLPIAWLVYGLRH